MKDHENLQWLENFEATTCKGFILTLSSKRADNCFDNLRKVAVFFGRNSQLVKL